MASETTIATRLDAMRIQANETPHLMRLGRLFSETVLLQIDAQEFYLHFDRGCLAEIQHGPSRKTPWRFAFRCQSLALEAFWQTHPAAGFHDIFGLVKNEYGRIDGDILCLVKNLRFFKEFMALGRERMTA